MYQIIEGSTQNLPDVEEFLETLTLLEQNPIPQARTLFDPQADDPRWGGYLANVTSSEFEKHYRANLPETIQGDQFLERYWPYSAKPRPSPLAWRWCNSTPLRPATNLMCLWGRLPARWHLDIWSYDQHEA
ncbi:hypothetical protein QUF63_00245 [Anaerolineales bacterium HSG25]|nr:hypothetical protein [Anaerolineales bacterium HSG25]